MTPDYPPSPSSSSHPSPIYSLSTYLPSPSSCSTNPFPSYLNPFSSARRRRLKSTILSSRPQSTALFVLILLLGSTFQVAHAAPQAPTATKLDRQQQQQQPQTRNEVNIAYFIQVSESTVTLLPRLLRSLWHPENTHVLHFDKKMPEWQREHAAATVLKSDARYAGNVHVMASEVVTYRGISMVLNNMNAMQAARAASSNWTYFINISGADYPLVSAPNQRRLLATRDFLDRNRSFISVAERGWWTKSKEYRYDRLFTDTSLALNESSAEVIDSYTDQPLAKINNFTFVAAEAWMMLHRTFVDFLLDSALSRRLLMAFAYSLEPEEHYFPTVMWNAPQFNATTVPHALRHVAWNHNGKHSGQHPYYVDRFERDGTTYMFKDSIVMSGCFFTRKIRVKDSPLLQFIDANVNGLAPQPVAANVNSYLQRVNRVLDCLAGCKSGTKSNICFPDWTE